MDESVHTVNAAAVVLAAAARSSTGLHRHHNHLQQQLLRDDHATAATRKIRWWSRLKAKLCFRPPHVHPRRIADDASSSSPQPATSYSVHHAPQPVFAFVAPPSSPATSLLHSEAPSPPALLLGGHGINSPSPLSIFAVGPYAHGPQQLVSPPVLYSAFTTEPSSASLTPPAPDLHLALAATTNPSSPEVPFARFLASSTSMAEQQSCGGLLQAAYQLQPGSPIPPGVSPSPSPQPFFRKLHRRNEGSLLDGHIPVLSTSGAGAGSDQEEEGRGGSGGDDDDEVPKSGEFVFGNADDGAAEDVDGNRWPAFPPRG